MDHDLLSENTNIYYNDIRIFKIPGKLGLMNQTIRTMNQHEFLTYIESVHAKLTDIATENGFAILLAATISDQKNGTTTA